MKKIVISADLYFKYLFTVSLTIICYSNQPTMKSMTEINQQWNQWQK